MMSSNCCKMPKTILKKCKSPAMVCYYPSLSYSIRDTMTHVKTESDDEECANCCYPCYLPVPYVESASIIDVARIPVIWVLGATEAIRHKQCKMVIEKLLCLTHISVKQMLSAEVTSGLKRSGIIQMMMGKGAQVPSELILEMIRERIVNTKDTTTGYLITEFPRERAHGIAFEKAIAAPSVIIFLQTSIEFLLNRQKECKASNRCNCYHLQTETEQEEPQALRKNLEIIEKYTKDILLAFRDKVRCVNGEQSENEINYDILQILNPIMSYALERKEKYPSKKKTSHYYYDSSCSSCSYH